MLLEHIQKNPTVCPSIKVLLEEKWGSPAILVPPCVRLREVLVCKPSPVQQDQPAAPPPSWLYMSLYLTVCICLSINYSSSPDQCVSSQIHISSLLKIEQDSWLESRAACCGGFSRCSCKDEMDAAKPFWDCSCLSESGSNKGRRHRATGKMNKRIRQNIGFWVDRGG